MSRKGWNKITAFITCIIISIMNCMPVIAAEVPVTAHLHLDGEMCCETESEAVIEEGELCYKCYTGDLSYTKLGSTYPEIYRPCTHNKYGNDLWSARVDNVRVTCTVCGTWEEYLTYFLGILLCGGYN